MQARSSPIARTMRTTELGGRHLIVAGSLLIAGVVHVALAPEHLSEAAVLGFGFLGTGVGQLGLALAIVRLRSIPVAVLTVLLSAFCLVALLAAITVGLPFLAHGGAMGILGPTESLDDLGALTGMAELVSMIVGLSLLHGNHEAFAAGPRTAR